MMTIVTGVRLKHGAEHEWDSIMSERMAAVKTHPGWVGGQLLHPKDEPDKRVIVGTWQTRDDWQSWHEDPLFEETRQKLDGLATGPAEHTWHDVVLDVRPGKGARSAGSAGGKRSSTRLSPHGP